ncbi:MAG: amidohydrolase [Chloroflexota bacterium]|nr:amidohydrolase [Chloroflexota bacterium]
MLIVDAQVHIWGAGPPTTRSHRQVEVFSAEELLKGMDEAGVDAAVIHPPGWDPNSSKLATQAVLRYPNRFAILGNFPLDRPESRELVDGWKSRPGMLGLRFTFHGQRERNWRTDGTIDWLWPAAERAGVPIALQAVDFLPVVGRVAERHPGLRLIVDHLGGRGGTTTATDAEAFEKLPELLALAKYPNVAVKATGAPNYSSEPYPFRSIHPYLRQIYDAFGPERMFWGTDISRMRCSYRECVTFFTEELPWLAERDKELIMGRALLAWLDWHLPG